METTVKTHVTQRYSYTGMRNCLITLEPPALLKQVQQKCPVADQTGVPQILQT